MPSYQTQKQICTRIDFATGDFGPSGIGKAKYQWNTQTHTQICLYVSIVKGSLSQSIKSVCGVVQGAFKSKQ